VKLREISRVRLGWLVLSILSGLFRSVSHPVSPDSALEVLAIFGGFATVGLSMVLLLLAAVAAMKGGTAPWRKPAWTLNPLDRWVRDPLQFFHAVAVGGMTTSGLTLLRELFRRPLSVGGLMELALCIGIWLAVHIYARYFLKLLNVERRLPVSLPRQSPPR
jgi:hypothetical protein